MSELESGWGRVTTAFEDWIEYESTEFAPWTGYFSKEGLHDLTDDEKIGWMFNMCDVIIPERVDRCREAQIALEDFLPYMPGSDAIETVQSMIRLCEVIENSILVESDIISNMADEFKAGGISEIQSSLEALAETEEDVRHHMSLFSQGFGKLRSLGLDISEEME